MKRAAFSAAVVGLVLVACGGGHPVASGAAGAVHCPDLAKADEVGAFDYAREYRLSREGAEKLKAAALTAIEINTLADKLDADLGIACTQIAHDLGNKGDFRSGTDACVAATIAVHDARGRVGAKATASLGVRPPLCLADASAMTKCASLCDASVPAGKAKGECEQTSGRCDAKCDGACEAKAPAKCDGTCTGTCDGYLKGTCNGRCRGTCDGKPSTGLCTGVCAGACEKGPVSGECKGSCAGACKRKAPAICDGTCVGPCSVELTDAKCSGGFKTPEVSAECRTRCELAVMNQTECAAPQVGFLAVGGNAEAAAAMKASVDKTFPPLMKTFFELGEANAVKRVLAAQAVIDGTRDRFHDLASDGGGAQTEEALMRCFDDSFKKASASATTIKRSLDLAEALKDEATKKDESAPATK